MYGNYTNHRSPHFVLKDLGRGATISRVIKCRKIAVILKVCPLSTWYSLVVNNRKWPVHLVEVPGRNFPRLAAHVRPPPLEPLDGRVGQKAASYGNSLTNGHTVTGLHRGVADGSVWKKKHVHNSQALFLDILKKTQTQKNSKLKPIMKKTHGKSPKKPQNLPTPLESSCWKARKNVFQHLKFKIWTYNLQNSSFFFNISSKIILFYL